MRIQDLFENPDSYLDSPIKPYLIAEAGVNHEGSMDLAKRLIEEAKEGGADAIKFQTYKAATLAAKDSPSYWDTSKEPTRNQFELFSKHDSFWKDEFEQLKMHCDRVGIEFLSSAFDMESADFLNPLMDVFKISSSDITNKPFIEYLCGFGKPIILSTGASDLSEIQEAVSWIEKQGNKLALLHCVLNYPTLDEHANLGMILGLKMHFPDKIIGYSDHTLPQDMRALEVATLLGARILEKHFTFDKSLPGNDHYHAMDKRDLVSFRERIDELLSMVGQTEVHALAQEKAARKNARRSLVANGFIPKGTRIKAENLIWKRPATGIEPKHIERLIGMTSLVDIPDDTILQWEMFS